MPYKNDKVPTGSDGRIRVTLSLDKWTAEALQKLLDQGMPGTSKISISRVVRVAIREYAKTRGIHV